MDRLWTVHINVGEGIDEVHMGHIQREATEQSSAFGRRCAKELARDDTVHWGTLSAAGKFLGMQTESWQRNQSSLEKDWPHAWHSYITTGFMST